jgi:hypothetical protein
MKTARIKEKTLTDSNKAAQNRISPEQTFSLNMLLPFEVSIDNETKESDRLGWVNYYIVFENLEAWPA